jgi:hypothetical protein
MLIVLSTCLMAFLSKPVGVNFALLFSYGYMTRGDAFPMGRSAISP